MDKAIGDDVPTAEWIVNVWKGICILSNSLLILNIILTFVFDGINIFQDVTGDSVTYSILTILLFLPQILTFLIMCDIVWSITLSSNTYRTIYMTILYISLGIEGLVTIITVIVLYANRNDDPAYPGDARQVAATVIINMIFYVVANVSIIIFHTYQANVRRMIFMEDETNIPIIPQGRVLNDPEVQVTLPVQKAPLSSLYLTQDIPQQFIYPQFY